MISAYYDTVFTAAQGQGLLIETAADHAATAFLDSNATTRTDTGAEPIDTLYPDGFSARKFIEVVESAAVWTATA